MNGIDFAAPCFTRCKKKYRTGGKKIGDIEAGLVFEPG